MSAFIETLIMFAPWAVGMADASLTAYYSNKFVATDIDTTRGQLTGTSGNAILGLGTATLAVESWAVLEWIKYAVKMSEGKIQTRDYTPKYKNAMQWFWWMMLFFYLVATVLAALNVQLATHWSDVDAHVRNKKLGGTYGDAVEGMSYATLAVGGITFFTYLYAEFGAKSPTDSSTKMTELHG